MKISKSHKRFSERLKNRRVLSNPEEFLGPNYKAVLNFWLRLDDLTVGQFTTIRSRYFNFRANQYFECNKALEEALDASYETIGREFTDNSDYASWDVYRFSTAFSVSRELIGMHKILEQNKPLTFFELFLNP